MFNTEFDLILSLLIKNKHPMTTRDGNLKFIRREVADIFLTIWFFNIKTKVKNRILIMPGSDYYPNHWSS